MEISVTNMEILDFFQLNPGLLSLKTCIIIICSPMNSLTSEGSIVFILRMYIEHNLFQRGTVVGLYGHL